MSAPDTLLAAAAAAPSRDPTAARGDTAMLHHGLADACSAGLPLGQALDLLRAELQQGRLRRACAALGRELDAGVPFAEAYGRCQADWPPAYQALVEAGVASGDLAAALGEIAAHASLTEEVRATLRQRLGHPLLTAAVVLGLGVVLVLAVGPSAFQPMTDELLGMLRADEQAPALGTVWKWPPALLAGALAALLLLAAGLWLGFAWLRRPLEAAGPKGLGFRLPVLGRLRADAARASFAATLALLLRRMLPLHHALALCARSATAPEVRARVARMAELAEQGHPLGPALRGGALLPASLLWFVESAATSGAVVRALDDLARLYRQRVLRAAERAALLVVPLLQLAAGLAVTQLAIAYAFPGLRGIQAVFGW